MSQWYDIIPFNPHNHPPSRYHLHVTHKETGVERIHLPKVSELANGRSGIEIKAVWSLASIPQKWQLLIKARGLGLDQFGAFERNLRGSVCARMYNVCAKGISDNSLTASDKPAIKEVVNQADLNSTSPPSPPGQRHFPRGHRYSS